MTLRWVDTARRQVRRLTAAVLAVLLVALTAVTVIDVAGRYLFNAPLPGGTELTELLVMAVVFAGLPAICLDDGHVTVDIFTSALRGAAARVQLNAARLFSAVVLGLAAWQLWVQGLRLAATTRTTVYLQIPLAPAAFAAAALCVVAAALSLVLAVGRAPRD